ncbi:MAG: hypothetical protein D6722_27680, partial [Bacteroidetes bacterium]
PLLSLLILLSSLPLLAQEVSEGTRPFMKRETANSLSVVVLGQPKNVEAVLDEKIRTATDDRGRTRSGLRAYEGVRYPAISGSQIDIYYRVERASRQDDSHSRVTLFLAAGNNNFMNSRKYPREIGAATDMLMGLELDVMIYEMGLLIEEQKKVIEKEVKTHERLVRDSVDLQTQLAETLQAIEDNKVARATQLEVIKQQEARLQEFEDRLRQLNQGERIYPQEEDEEADNY